MGEPRGLGLLSSSAVGKAGFVPQFRALSITSSLLCHFDKPSDFLPTQGFKRALQKGAADATFPNAS